MNPPNVVYQAECEAARQELLAKETPPYQWWHLHDEYESAAR